jgi:hypothetical protein
MSCYNKGSKINIMNAFSLAIKPGIAGVSFVDFQRDYDTGIGPEKMPGAFVNDVFEEKRFILGDVVLNTLQVGVVCWVRAGATESLWEKLNAFVQAIIDAVYASTALAAEAASVSCERIGTDSGSRHPVGVAVLMFRVLYYSDK